MIWEHVCIVLTTNAYTTYTYEKKFFPIPHHLVGSKSDDARSLEP